MQCDRARELTGPYIDGELTVEERQSVTEHMAACAACAAFAEDHVRIGRQIAEAGRETAPKAMALRIRAALAEEAAATPRATEAAELMPTEMQRLPGRAPAAVRAPPRDSHWTYARQAAALATACVLSSALTFGAVTLSGMRAGLESEIVAAHVRSLLQESPVQIASSDQHAVKPWFNGRIDFAPDVKDLTAEGFPLVGGRLDYVGERRVGAVVYRRRMHVVNVLMWPAPSAEARPPRLETVKGYNLLSWSRNGVTYWAVSDLNAGELRQLQSLM